MPLAPFPSTSVAFAGFWSTWRSPDGDDITSFTIVTTEPNALMAGIHSRMPVILGADDHDRWLDLDADATDVLKPCPAGLVGGLSH
ncbi:MAG: SOS response-associated peptidase family protein [Pseudomonadota bacterium]